MRPWPTRELTEAPNYDQSGLVSSFHAPKLTEGVLFVVTSASTVYTGSHIWLPFLATSQYEPTLITVQYRFVPVSFPGWCFERIFFQANQYGVTKTTRTKLFDSHLNLDSTI